MVSGRSEAITIVTSVFFGVSLITVLLRCFVRLRVVRAFGWDDGLMVFAMVSPFCELKVSHRVLIHSRS